MKLADVGLLTVPFTKIVVDRHLSWGLITRGTT